MPNVVIVAGPNGAGKSTTAPKLLRDVFAVEEFVNADAIAAGLSAFAPERVAFTAGRAMIQRLNELFRLQSDFAFESTLASRSFAPWLGKLKHQGYIVHLIYLWLPTADLAIERVAERVRRGGHSIPDTTVRRRFERSLFNFFSLYRPIADSWLLLDNSEHPEPRPIARRPLGHKTEIIDHAKWNELQRHYEKDSFDKS